MTGRFTGWHMTAILVAFFAVVIGVNLYMAGMAVGTFGGTVVDNSYVASQKFDIWLAQARDQDALGWKSQITLDGARHVEIHIDHESAPLVGAAISARAVHPLGRLNTDDLRFVPVGAGSYRSVAALPDGRWYVHIDISKGGQTAKLVQELL